jgi:mycothione reductase
VDVTLVARSSVLLRSEDEDISARFTELAGQRADVRLNRKTMQVTRSADGVSVELEGPQGAETIKADEILIAVGRTPNSDLLDVAATGLSTRDSGHIVVDEHQRTGVDGIYALGDISSAYELKHVANHEARVVQHNLLHPDAPIATDHRFVPHAVFSSPQIAAVGLTEQDARERGVPYVVSKQDYAGMAYGWADPATGQLIGAHIIGPQAPTVIQPLIQAMSFGLDARSMARGQYWIHPAMPELIENALLNLPLG